LVRPCWYVYLFPELLIYSNSTGGKKREIGVKMIFGETELKVRALNKRTGEETNAKFDVYLHVSVKTLLA
jgi:hypothetical protein